MILSFEHLEPLTGSAPATLSQYGNHILKRARALLKQRTSQEIDEILAFINWITDLEEIRNFALDRLILEAEADENGTEPPDYIGDYSTISFQISLYKSKYGKTNDSIENMEWHEVYATLAIALLNEGIDDELYLGQKWRRDKGEWIHEWRILDHVSTWVVEATEAITIAEGLHQFRDHLTKTEKALSDRNTRAAIEKHEKTNIAILELEKMHLSGNFKSLRNTVQIYCAEYPEKVNHLIHYNRVRTLSEGLSAHLKGRRRSIANELQD